MKENFLKNQKKNAFLQNTVILSSFSPDYSDVRYGSMEKAKLDLISHENCILPNKNFRSFFTKSLK